MPDQHLAIPPLEPGPAATRRAPRTGHPRCAAAVAGRHARMGDQRGMALVTALIVMTVILFIGAFAIVSSRSEIRTSANYRGRLQAQYFAESGIDEIVGYQNDLTAEPRFLFDPKNYTYTSSDSSVFYDLPATDPEAGTTIGTVHRVVLDKDPTTEGPPYRIWSTASIRDGSQATYEVEVDVTSLLDYAFYSELGQAFCSNATTLGRVYVQGDLTVLNCGGTPHLFKKLVEYTGSLSGGSYADFREGSEKVPAYPPLTSLVNLPFYRSAAEKPGVCGSGVGLLIATSKVPFGIRTQSANLFGIEDGSSPGVKDTGDDDDWDDANGEAVTGCSKGTAGIDCFQIDLTLFDFTADPITYGGVALLGGDGKPLRPATFNGIVYVDDELHVWGIVGGRSPEDRTVQDSVTSYDVASIKRLKTHKVGSWNPPLEKIDSDARGRPFHHHPDFDQLKGPWKSLKANLYSNNVLDPGEDANGNGILDPAGLGRSLTIVTGSGSDILVDHNIYYGTDENGERVSLGLLSGDAIYVDANSPRVQLTTGAKLARGQDVYSGYNISLLALPMDDASTHRRNFWAKAAGDLVEADSTYVFDLDGDGLIEADNGLGQAGDRNETRMRDAWAVLDLGNIVTAGTASYGIWSSDAHARTFMYDFELVATEPPCWPVLPYYGVVPGSFGEVRN